jgi:hypothetical protein
MSDKTYLYEDTNPQHERKQTRIQIFHQEVLQFRFRDGRQNQQRQFFQNPLIWRKGLQRRRCSKYNNLDLLRPQCGHSFHNGGQGVVQYKERFGIVQKLLNQRPCTLHQQRLKQLPRRILTKTYRCLVTHVVNVIQPLLGLILHFLWEPDLQSSSSIRHCGPGIGEHFLATKIPLTAFHLRLAQYDLCMQVHLGIHVKVG